MTSDPAARPDEGTAVVLISLAGRAVCGVISRRQFEGGARDLGVTDKVRPLIAAVRAMVRDEIMPLEEEYHAEVGPRGRPLQATKRLIEIRESLKAKARAKGLWNFWLTASDKGLRPHHRRIRLSR